MSSVGHSNVYEQIDHQVNLLSIEEGWPQERVDEALQLANQAEEEIFGWVELWESSAEEAKVLELWAAMLVDTKWAGYHEAIEWAYGAEMVERAEADVEYTPQQAAQAVPDTLKNVGSGVGAVLGLGLLGLLGLAVIKVRK